MNSEEVVNATLPPLKPIDRDRWAFAEDSGRVVQIREEIGGSPPPSISETRNILNGKSSVRRLTGKQTLTN